MPIGPTASAGSGTRCAPELRTVFRHGFAEYPALTLVAPHSLRRDLSPVLTLPHDARTQSGPSPIALTRPFLAPAIRR